MTQPRVVILVPRREGVPERDLNWSWIRDWWRNNLPEFEIFEGSHELGLFNRSCAINRAAGYADWKQPEPWDVAIIIDADVICDPARVRAAVAQAQTTGRMVMPFNVRYDLNEAGSKQVMDGFHGSWRPFIRHTYNQMVSSVNVVTRQLWNDVGGFDEGFIGWGFEDNAFCVACRTFGGGEEIRIQGDLWHFFHRTAPEGKRGTETHLRNKARAELYLRASGNREAIRAIRDSAPPAFEHRPYGIPRILHRTIPAKSIPEAEAFWKKAAKLHPDWQMMTHQDPLDPAQWRETGHKWDRCANGAQRAGLIRLEALWRWGGVYIDQDVDMVRSLEPLLPLSAFAAWEDSNCIPDAVIGAVPGHPAIRKCLDLALSRIPGDTWKSGPGVTTEVFRDAADVLVLPPASFYPVHYKDQDRGAVMRAASLMPHHWTFGVHRYWHSWGTPEQRSVPE